MKPCIPVLIVAASCVIGSGAPRAECLATSARVESPAIAAGTMSSRAAAGDAMRQDAIESIFNDVSSGLSHGDFRIVAKYFASKVFLNLYTGENGYFGSEQCTIILKNFLATWQPLSFTFTSINKDSGNPYGVGTLTYMRRGLRGTSQVYLSLSSIQGEWRITQLTVTRR